METVRARSIVRVGAMLCGVLFVSGVASGHVEYVGEGERGDPVAFLAEALSDPVVIGALAAGGIGVVAVIVLYLRVRPFSRDIAVFRRVMVDYSDLVPWLLRLGFGLPLIGAGFAGYFFAPAVSPTLVGSVPSRLFQIALGFLLLFGLATRAAALTGLVVYVFALLARPDLLFSLEWIPGFVAIALVGSGRPSADHTLQRVAAADGTFYGEIDPVHRAAHWLADRLEPYRRYLPTIVRIGMGVAFAFLGLAEKLLAPTLALGVVQQYGLADVTPIPPELWVLGAGLTECALGVALLVGFFTRASALTALFVFTLTLFALPNDPVLAHIGLFSLASTLLITGAGPYALDNRIGATGPPDSDPYSASVTAD
ncbi:DoxX family protein [Halalkalicoccus sp. NIPERK01]|uniref:DoxX family protein n=1 Tax=Halalkalicoccus sp. NIPERK01 TaxID=3053469 RepID=UPI00256F2BEC|nr:DoxX family protein [Halalkalicoccus sp. NIPERK01]MDL5360832.1 DoxX family protein [Halalkalicoccus sp. NIPERK01]